MKTFSTARHHFNPFPGASSTGFAVPDTANTVISQYQLHSYHFDRSSCSQSIQSDLKLCSAYCATMERLGCPHALSSLEPLQRLRQLQLPLHCWLFRISRTCGSSDGDSPFLQFSGRRGPAGGSACGSCASTASQMASSQTFSGRAPNTCDRMVAPPRCLAS